MLDFRTNIWYGDFNINNEKHSQNTGDATKNGKIDTRNYLVDRIPNQMELGRLLGQVTW